MRNWQMLLMTAGAFVHSLMIEGTLFPCVNRVTKRALPRVMSLGLVRTMTVLTGIESRVVKDISLPGFSTVAA